MEAAEDDGGESLWLIDVLTITRHTLRPNNLPPPDGSVFQTDRGCAVDGWTDVSGG